MVKEMVYKTPELKDRLQFPGDRLHIYIYIYIIEASPISIEATEITEFGVTEGG